MDDNEKLQELAMKMKEEEYKGLSREEIEKIELEKENKKRKNIEVLNDTLNVSNYSLSLDKLTSAKVFLPEDIDRLRNERKDININNSKCIFECVNMDSLSFAWEKYQNLGNNEKILVLNLASATNPGGKSREGASAQEEDLCRRSSLLMSLEGISAKKYYEYNNKFKSHLGTDAIILSPYVEVIKDESCKKLDKPFVISVLSCSAPMIRFGLEGLSEQEYKEMLYKRIEGIFLVSAVNNYKHLVLGAFGCGIYGNDAKVVSTIFKQVIDNFIYNGKKCNELFHSINFAILCKQDNDYNYQEFSKYFKNE